MGSTYDTFNSVNNIVPHRQFHRETPQQIRTSLKHSFPPNLPPFLLSYLPTTLSLSHNHTHTCVHLQNKLTSCNLVCPVIWLWAQWVSRVSLPTWHPNHPPPSAISPEPPWGSAVRMGERREGREGREGRKEIRVLAGPNGADYWLK